MLGTSQRPPDHCQGLVHDELTALEKQALQPQTKRNGHTDISRLPDEILLEIFKILQGTKNSLESWFKINLVCRHWRYVAVDAAVLWSNPPTKSHELTVLMLERSRMCDLHVELTNGTLPATTTAILNHVGRIRSLSIDQNTTSLNRTQALFRSSEGALRLNKLSVACSGYDPELVFFADAFQPLIQLISLELSTVRLDWDTFPLPNLTFLSLTNIALSNKLPCYKLLEALRHMPSLYKIVLDLDFLSENISRTMDQKAIELPCLSSFDAAEATPGQVEYILLHLTLPRLQRLEICCIERLRSNDVDNYMSFTQAISKTLANGAFAILDSLVIADHYLGLVPQQAISGSNGLDLILPYTDGADDTSYAIRDALAGFTPQILARLVDVHVTPCLTIPDPLFASFFGGLPRLESICVPDYSTEAMIKSLIIPAEHSPPCIPFPKLQEVSFRSTLLSRSMMERLCSCLVTRCTFGAPLSKLTLKSCKIDERGLELIRAAGVEVISTDTKLVEGLDD